MSKRPKPNFLTLTPAQRRSLATWIFGTLLLIFFVCVFAFAPRELPEFKQRMLAIASAVMSGLFAFFLTGEIGLEIKPIKSRFGDFGVKASGGIAVFVLVLWWWLSPWAPVGVQARIEKLEEALAVSMATSPHDGIPMPPARARELAKRLSATNAYALGLAAIANDRFEYGWELLNQVEKAKDLIDPWKLFVARGQIRLFEGRYAEAVDWFTNALSIKPNDPDLLNAAGVAMIHAGKFDEARTVLQKTEGIWKRVLGAKNADAARGLNNLAAVYHHFGKLSEAENYYLQSASILRERLGEDNADVATCLSNLASLYQDQDRSSEAGTLYERVIAIQEKILKPDDPHLAITYNNLAELRQKQNKIEDIEFLYQRALNILEKPGREHLNLATILNNLGGLYVKQTRYDKSEELYQRALAIRRRILGSTNTIVAESLNNLAMLYLKQNKFDQAEPLMRQALTIFEQTKGTNDPAVAGCMKNLGALYRNLGRYEEAERYYRRALEIREKFGPMHPDVATSLHDLAVLYYRQKRIDEARQYFRQALSIWEKTAEPDEHKLLLNLENLSGLECEQGNYAVARPLCLRAIKLREKLWGPDHPDLPQSLKQYREVLLKLNETAEANEIDARVQSMKVHARNL